ncbi:MAG TPA: DNA cytosine methyltransferase [Nocardioides sp.]|nr:DNA cytosine methyltransferase [Nocardioides sp.]
MPIRYASLFSGVGGLDRAIDAMGGEAVVQVEREPYCLDVLARRWPTVERVTDVRDYHPAVGTLDMIVGGPPCQPVSQAGRRKGTDDDRWLWGEALRVVRESAARFAFFENPLGLRTLGLDGILAELSDMGYGGAWEVVAAADVGAPHLRKRLFILAERGRTGWEGPTRPKGNRRVLWPTPTAIERPNEGNVRLLRARVLDGTMTEDEAAGMLNGKSPFEAQGKVTAMRPPAFPFPVFPTPSASDNRDRGGIHMPAIQRRMAAGRQLNLSMTVSNERGALNPDWVEWLMGLPIGWTDVNADADGEPFAWESEPAIPRVGLGIPNRRQRLTALGNAVVPQQAEFAFLRLVERLTGVEVRAA